MRRAKSLSTPVRIENLERRLVLSSVLVSAANGGANLGANSSVDFSTALIPNENQKGVISADGRYVCFISRATNLVAGVSDTNAVDDVFVRDLATGTTQCVSVIASGSATGSAGGNNAVISADGRFVAFQSASTNLPGDSDSAVDIFVRDLSTNVTKLASKSISGISSSGAFAQVSISAGGRYVAFIGSGSGSQVLRYDRVADTIAGVSVTSSLAFGNGDSVQPNISADGRYISFESSATNLGPSDSDSGTDIYVRDMTAQTTARASTGIAGGLGSPIGVNSTLASGGRVVVFSTTTKLVAADTNNGPDLYARNLDTNVLSLVTANPAGNSIASGGTLFYPSLSADGRYVAFSTRVVLTNQPDSNAAEDVYVRDLSTNITTLISINSSGNSAGSDSSLVPSISDDGKRIAFTSSATDLVSMPNTHDQTFLRDLNAGTTQMISLGGDGTVQGNATTISPAFISGNGSRIVFATDASNTIPSFVNQNNSFRDIYAAAVGMARPSIGVFRNGTFYVDASGDHAWGSGDVSFNFGSAGDAAVVGDWNGDGVIDAAVYRGNTFYIDLNGSNSWNSGDVSFNFGAPGDTPITGDWNGDHITDVGVYRGNVFYLDLNGSRSWNSGDIAFNFGAPGDTPVSGDWNGDDISEVGVYRGNTFYLDINGSHSWNAGDTAFNFGIAGDKPVAGDWNGDGITDIGVQRGNQFFLDANGSQTWNSGDLSFLFGAASDTPIAGIFI